MLHQPDSRTFSKTLSIHYLIYLITLDVRVYGVLFVALVFLNYSNPHILILIYRTYPTVCILKLNFGVMLN